MNHLFQLNDSVVDLSQIKAIHLSINYANETEKKLMLIQLRDRIIFRNGRNSEEGIERIPESLEFLYKSESEARRALSELQEAWNRYIDSKPNG